MSAARPAWPRRHRRMRPPIDGTTKMSGLPCGVRRMRSPHLLSSGDHAGEPGTGPPKLVSGRAFWPAASATQISWLPVLFDRTRLSAVSRVGSVTIGESGARDDARCSGCLRSILQSSSSPPPRGIAASSRLGSRSDLPPGSEPRCARDCASRQYQPRHPRVPEPTITRSSFMLRPHRFPSASLKGGAQVSGHRLDGRQNRKAQLHLPVRFPR